MALRQGHESDADEYHSLSPHEDDHDHDNDSLDDAASGTMDPPIHPVPSMQGAFEESIIESTDEQDQPLKPPDDLNPEMRRRALLEAHRYDPSWKTRWKQRPSAIHHPLRKLMAQILFGMHLLQQNQAKSNDEVIRILQTHVDEVDTFLERTSEDFDCAIADIDERIHHLELPMAHLDVFKSMLEDKSFRSQLLSGNDKIDKIVDRTARAGYAALADVHQGIGANRELRTYLDRTQDLWPQDEPGIADVCNAMRGNEQGWMRYLNGLLVKGDTLNRSLIQLGTITGEMSRLAASVSRRSKSATGQSTSSKSKPTAGDLRSKFSRDKPTPHTSNLNKPLPRNPVSTNKPKQIPSRQHPIPLAERYESPREYVPAPKAPSEKDMPRSIKDVVPVRRPKTAGSVSRNEGETSAELAEFLRSSGPLSSNPPTMKQTRSRSHGATEILKDIQKLDAKKTLRRSQSQIALETVNEQHATLNDAARPGSRRADKAMSIQKESTMRRLSLAIRGRDHKSESAASNSGMQRRLSKRQKPNALPSPAARVEVLQRNAGPEQPPFVDSAYSSGTDKRAPPTVDKSIPELVTPSRPPSRLSLFPKASSPLDRHVADTLKPSSPYEAPIADVSQRSGSLGANMAPRSPNEQSAVSKSTHGRALSIRHMFNRRQRAEGIVG
ncbi:Hypothetical protein R9X50_00074400 [Acrodontium crateriforme]|uniref:Uncharacterized protein n=1 Tax=Acrodontium crateriforme TaxID=150365 RepID=A0AAQ3M3S2_9PEZI|nr:Hypothetical protein R9X50_00074400 [Acrodontium crateriforme]